MRLNILTLFHALLDLLAFINCFEVEKLHIFSLNFKLPDVHRACHHLLGQTQSIRRLINALVRYGVRNSFVIRTLGHAHLSFLGMDICSLKQVDLFHVLNVSPLSFVQ